MSLLSQIWRRLSWEKGSTGSLEVLFQNEASFVSHIQCSRCCKDLQGLSYSVGPGGGGDCIVERNVLISVSSALSEIILPWDKERTE